MSEFAREKNSEPWLIFKVHKNNYVVNTKKVLAISRLPEEIMDVPDNQKYIRGIINFRGDIIPLIDMKLLFKQKSSAELESEFIKIIDAQDLKMNEIVAKFTECVQNDEYFEYVESFENSEFISWLDTYIATIPDLKYSVNKIVKFRKELLVTFKNYDEKIKNSIKLGDIEKRRLLFNTVDNIIADLHDLFDKTKILYHSYLQEMIIEIVSDNLKIGLIVDEVKSIENIVSDIGQAEFNPKIYATKFIEGVAKTEKSKELVMMPNLNFLFDYAKKFDFEKVYDEFSSDDKDDMILNADDLISDENDENILEDEAQVEISEEDYEKMLNGEYTVK